MHFFYLDESGCTGSDLANEEQPIFVMGGISVKDKGWNKTQSQFSTLISEYFDGKVPLGFELHGSELLSPNGEGPFEGDSLEERLNLTRQVLDLVQERNHNIHLFAINKSIMAGAECAVSLPYDSATPYLCSFDYLITYINAHVRNSLGSSARGMVIMDRKEQFHDDVERITHERRFCGPQTHRVKWVVEFSYPIDSCKNPMIQISDLVLICARRFLEIDHGYRGGWHPEVVRFYAERYTEIHDRLVRKQLVERGGRGMDRLNRYLSSIRCEPIGQWRRRYGHNLETI